MPACVLNPFSRVQLFATLWTVARQTPLSMGYPRQEYWSELPFPSSRDLPNPGIEPVSPVAPALQADSLLPSHQGSPKALMRCSKRTGYPLVSISLTGRRLGWDETLLLPRQGTQTLGSVCCLCPFPQAPRKRSLVRAMWPFLVSSTQYRCLQSAPAHPAGLPPRDSSELVKNPIILGPQVKGDALCS